MTTEPTTNDTTSTKTVKSESVKLQQTSTVTLTANGAVMQLVAERKADGSAKTYVITTIDKKSARGMTEVHKSFEVAKAAIATSATKAEKLGWIRKVAGRVFTAKPDAFTSLPAAPKAKK